MDKLAQYYYEYDSTTYTNYDSVDGAAAAAVGMGIVLFGLLIFAAFYVVGALFLSKIFKKAGVPSWIAWVPFYNMWKLLEIGGQQGFWAVLSIIPVVNYVAAVFMFIAAYHVGKKLGKDGTFVLLAIFLPLIWVIWLGADKSKWNEAGSTARSLHKPTA